MDDSPIQTALCVVGHPIGGNPTQFVAQRALAALGLDWQFVSFDVAPDQIQRAINGIDSLGFCGAMIASPYQSQIARLLSLARDEPAAETVQWHDCLSRDSDKGFVVSNLYAESLGRTISSHIGPTGASLQQCVLLGEQPNLSVLIEPFLSVLPTSRFIVTGSKICSWPLPISTAATPNTDAILDTSSTEPMPVCDAEATPSLIIWTYDTKPTKKPPTKPPANAPAPSFVAETLIQLHPDSLIVDLSGTAGAWLTVRSEHSQPLIKVINKIDLEVYKLVIAIHRWTGKEPNIELVREAIEEYLEI